MYNLVSYSSSLEELKASSSCLSSSPPTRSLKLIGRLALESLIIISSSSPKWKSMEIGASSSTVMKFEFLESSSSPKSSNCNSNSSSNSSAKSSNSSSESVVSFLAVSS
ncbi:hypothetical protein WICPIJ_002836 [Wickerhamomyces pijperi]|uniref:Uncharacterized protein n=1 Tax=Wickerhamomyces pijperi TaxID=599730 RepID=A0A9P8QAX7_WICPI|nr:hypothetical protein WICPIJ_002836 [Wickerhamomyces pijperi]